MDTWDACEHSWKNGYEKGSHDMAKYVVNWLCVLPTMNKDELYETIIKDFKNYKEETND